MYSVYECVCVCVLVGWGGGMNANKTVVFESRAGLETDCSLCFSPQAVGRVSLSLSRGVGWCWVVVGGVCPHRIPQSSVNPSQSEACVGSWTLTPAPLISQPGVPHIASSPPPLLKKLLSQSSSSGFRITSV